MRPPKNFDNKMNRRKQLLPEVPQATAEDAGKIIKVGETGAYELGNDENTVIIANPDTTPSETLNALTIGSTTYKVNDARVTKILGLRFTIDNGGTYNANLPQISIVNEYGEAAVLPTNTMTCDKPVQYGALTPTGTPGVLVENLPAVITLVFAAEFNIEDYPNIKLTKGSLFPQDIAKNIKIEYSLNNDDWVEIADLVSIDWTGDYHIYDMSTGEETETTPAIPTPTAADAGKVLTVDNNGAWELRSEKIKVYDATLSSGTYHLTEEQYSTLYNEYQSGIAFIIRLLKDCYLVTSCNQFSTTATKVTLSNNTITVSSVTFNLSNGSGTLVTKSIT